ncbi:MAG: Holliday junction resolvase RuvX [Ileibacterium sp.]|nr:Holliday junction resolvase RuvX [Ileibacterium sp.]
MERIIGLDLGSKTCGVAICDPLQMIARALTTVRFESDDYETCLKEVVDLCRQNKVKEVVLGLPKHMNGDIGIRGKISEDFAAKLEENGIHVTLWDERLTTVSAEKLLISGDVSRKKRKKVIDQMAAVQILQSYLDRKNGGLIR